MKETMKALVKTAPGQGLELKEVAVPTYGPNDVLIHVKKVAICGTDVHIYTWDEWSQKTINTPMVIGHEYVGEVVAKGDNVEGIEIGEVVTGEGHLVCGQCRHCRAGKFHLCKDTKGVGVNRDGCFAEYLAIPASNVWHTDENIDPEVYAIFDPFGNATHTALSFDVMGEDVLITGAGPIGIMAAMICEHIRARNVVITDVNDKRLELARSMGLKNVVDTRVTDLKDVQKALNMKEGFDIGLEMSGNQYALKSMIENLYHGGKIAMLGIQGEDASVDWNQIVFKCLTIKGIYGREMYETWYKMQMLLDTGLDIGKIITHRLKFEEFEKGFEAMISGEAGKVILDLEYLW